MPEARVLHLELGDEGPMNARLARALKRAVLDGRLARGARLPATRELARSLGVSRNTVVDAYEQLVAEGFLHGRVGAGTFVALAAAPRAAAPGSARPARLSGWGAGCAMARRMRRRSRGGGRCA